MTSSGMSPHRQVIAIGGAGFAIEPENPAFEKYLLRQARTDNPAVCFLATASGDAEAYIANFYATFSRLGCRPSHVTFFGRTPDLRSHFLNQEIIFVGGGNTKSMLAVWREWGADIALREAWENGIVLAGTSAGAICWFQQGVTDSFEDRLTALPCLGFLPGSCCPHYDGEPERRPGYRELLGQNDIMPGYAIDDGAAIHFVGNEINRVIVCRPDAGAYYVQAVAGSIHEQSLRSEFIGND